jgi:anaerobic ribonucleoside-triphosphate reductase activating protein
VSRHHGSQDATVVHVVRRKAATAVLGPGVRAVIWVAGCLLNCRGCIAPETHPLGGDAISIPRLAAWLSAVARDGITLTGGEPMLQSPAMCRLIDLVREPRPDLHVMLFTGYRLEWLLRRGCDSQRELLRRVDLLVDGPYVERLHAPLKWRGSSNQRLIDLTGRTPGLEDDAPAGLEFELDEQLRLDVTGVPEAPGFRPWLESLTATTNDRRNAG